MKKSDRDSSDEQPAGPGKDEPVKDNGQQPGKDYYYDDATGYEIYERDADEDDSGD